MNNELIDKLLPEIEEAISKKTELLPFSTEKGFLPIKISENNFHQIKLFGKEKKMIGIDGGNTNILNTPQLSVDFIRIAAAHQLTNNTKKTIVKEFYIVTTINMSNKDPAFSIQYIGNNIENSTTHLPQKFPLKYTDINNNHQTVEIDQIAGIVRRLSEIELAHVLIKSEENSLIIVDGSMEAKHEKELLLINKLLKSSKESSSDIIFFSKTCRLLTHSGSSLSFTLSEIGPKSSWFYFPVFTTTNNLFQADIYFVKLNSNSYHIFRIDIPKNNSNPSDIFLSLSINSKDPVFLGYPYVLIVADKMARVSNKECDYLKTAILSRVKDKSKLSHLISTLDSHDILDNIG